MSRPAGKPVPHTVYGEDSAAHREEGARCGSAPCVVQRKACARLASLAMRPRSSLQVVGVSAHASSFHAGPPLTSVPPTHRGSLLPKTRTPCQCSRPSRCGQMSPAKTMRLASAAISPVRHRHTVTQTQQCTEGRYTRGVVHCAVCGVRPPQSRPSAPAARGRVRLAATRRSPRDSR